MSETQDFDDIQRAIDAYLGENGWSKDECDCGRRFFYKRGRDGSCQSRSCVDGFPFLGAGESNKFRGSDEIGLELLSLLTDHGFDRQAPAPVDNRRGTTFLTNSAVQALDDVLFQEAPYDANASQLVAQPSVRMNAADHVGDSNGFSTSFVNIATLSVDPEPSKMVGHLDAWFEALSSLGLLVSNFALLPEVVRGIDWGRGEFSDYVLSINYGGLTLGECILHRSFPQQSRAPIDILDTGFGLERVSWAVNRTPSYFDAIGPIRACIHRPVVFVDAVRTLTLLAGQGVDPGPEGAGYRFRKLEKQLLRHTTTPNFGEIITHNHKFWKHFCNLADVETVRGRIRAEFDRNYNRRFRDVPNAPDLETNTENYLRTLASRGYDFEEIEEWASSEPDSSPDESAE